MHLSSGSELPLLSIFGISGTVLAAWSQLLVACKRQKRTLITKISSSIVSEQNHFHLNLLEASARLI